MKTELKEAMTSGVFVEFRDARGNTLGQVVYSNWRGRPVPAVGDALQCELKGTGQLKGTVVRRSHKVRGKVVSRQFDVQCDEHGEPCVWVIIVAQVRAVSTEPGFNRTVVGRFSDN